MAVKIKLNYVRHSAKKLRPFARIVKGKTLDNAIDITAVLPNDSARFINKALKMAAASAKDKAFVPGTMIVSEVMATEGPRIKRVRPNARGRANKYQKHIAHLTIALSEPVEKKGK
ncbi:50S ribosomal protein L22 [Candidatus Berkelbacteria bacterium]|nr:50S ribosomal protein L22 [Candidatus Berkelbacteria bacterium]